MSKKTFDPIEGGVLEGISKILGETNKGLSGREIGKFLAEAKIPDTDPAITKWIRIYNAFVNWQNRNKVSNNILKFITLSMSPSRFVNKNDEFENLRHALNTHLSFIGLQLKENGILSPSEISTTISEAQAKANRFKDKLEKRNVHTKIYEYCKAELLAENYFHSVFEAVKSVADRIREKTNLTKDGNELIEIAFSINSPLIKINDLSTETKQSEHKGFANLLKGVFGMFRNTIAHAPKITWNMEEQDALDIMSTISLIHRKLDQAQ